MFVALLSHCFTSCLTEGHGTLTRTPLKRAYSLEQALHVSVTVTDSKPSSNCRQQAFIFLYFRLVHFPARNDMAADP